MASSHQTIDFPAGLPAHPFDDDRLHEECGVFAITGHDDAAALCALGLHALQHRGQESAGIVSYDGTHFHQHVAFGKVGDNFGSQEVIACLQGNDAIGHNRYSTSGEKRNINNIQPLFAELSVGGVAVAHNGNLTNAKSLRKELVSRGSIFRTTMDSEVIIHLIATSKASNVLDSFIDALSQIEGGFSVVSLSDKTLIGARDPLGIRPLVLGKLEDSYIFASETCAFDIIGAEYIRDVEAGEVVVINEGLVQSFKPFKPMAPRFCIFEYVYFSRPDSTLEGKNVYNLRKNMGTQLAKESHIEVDVIVPVPDSGVPAAMGYAEASGVPYELGIIRNHYIGRTFIEPTDSIRHLGVKLKHNANRSVIEGKRVLLIDDSIVRGTTSKKIVEMVRTAGAKEVHMRISCPPTIDPCFYGVDTPSKDKLLAAQKSVDEIAEFIGVDSLAYLSIDGMYQAVSNNPRNNDAPQYCDACFTGDYPVDITDKNIVQLPLLDAIIV